MTTEASPPQQQPETETTEMPVYDHFQLAKNANPQLPKASDELIGACLTCTYWQVETTQRPEKMVNQVALCVYPALKPYALIVSGSSACNKWKLKEGVIPEARKYAERFEKK